MTLRLLTEYPKQQKNNLHFVILSLVSAQNHAAPCFLSLTSQITFFWRRGNNMILSLIAFFYSSLDARYREQTH